MYIVKRIETMLKGWENQPSKADVECLEWHYKNQSEKLFTKADLLDLMHKDALNLIQISRYADMGEMKALEFAFSLGYEAGKAGRHSDEK